MASRRHGEGRPDDAARTVYQAFWLALGVALILGASALAGLWALFSLMGTPGEVTVQGSGYLAVYLVGVPIVFIYFVMDAAFRAAGDTRTPLRLLTLALALNFVLDPLLILGVGPFPRLGIQGAALATLLTRSAALLLGLWLLVRRGLIRREPPTSSVMGRMAWVGAPVAAAGAVFSVIYILLTRITSGFGTAALAALGVGHKVESLGYMLCVGFGIAAATAVGQNLGAGAPRRAEGAGNLATGYALAVTAIVGAAFLLVPRQLMGVFSDDPSVIAAGASYLRIVAPAQLFMALEIVLEMAMDGAGYTLVPMVFSVVLSALRLPAAILLRGPLGLAGIWWAISSTAMARGSAAAAVWHTGRWKRRPI